MSESPKEIPWPLSKDWESPKNEVNVKTVWKFPLRLVDEQEVSLPDGAKILCAQVQGATLCLWALVDPDKPAATRAIRIYGTGRPIPDSDSLVYVDTFQVERGALVFHVFERSPREDRART